MPISFAEKVSRLPARAPWMLRDVVSNQEIDLHKLDGGIEVEYGVLYECHVEASAIWVRSRTVFFVGLEASRAAWKRFWCGSSPGRRRAPQFSGRILPPSLFPAFTSEVRPCP